MDYPLITRAKGTAAFRQAIIDFFSSFIDALATSGHLFESPEVLENIEIWVGTLSSAANRPFRHTATLVALSIIGALAETGRGLVETEAQTVRQRDSEKKKRQKNQQRISDLEKKAKETDQKKKLVIEYMKAWFDAVFVHRYRDVDPRIRVDCAQSLGEWIMTYPDYFFEGTHLRYLGWVLSDSHGSTRLEVVRQLQRLYHDKSKLGGLKTFTERFRPRMVEMATSDAEVSVRVATLELLDMLREAGFLEPDDVDTIGKLIFDSEPRIRKALVQFFAENINDMYEMKVEEIGGQEAIEEAGYEVDEEVYDKPRLEWLKFKALAEILNGYDSQEGNDTETDVADLARQGYLIVGSGIETRLSLAAQDLYSHIPEIELWQVIGGYLLFDHSSKQRKRDANEIEIKIRKEAALDEREQIVLLEVLNASVKMSFAETIDVEKDKRKTKAQRLEAQRDLDSSTRNLADLIPRLLKKFGASSETASAVLRLEPLLNLEVFEAARQETAGFAAHLDDINKQLLTHASGAVAAEASAALLHAREHEELGDITEPKFQELWDESINALHAIQKGRELSVRGSLNEQVLAALANVLLRIENFARISNCAEHLDKKPVVSKKSKSQPRDTKDAFYLILDILKRGASSNDAEADPEIDALEDGLVMHACYTLTFYFAWHIKLWAQRLQSGNHLSGVELEELKEKRDSLVRTLYQVIRSGNGASTVRTVAASTMLDVLTIIATLRTARVKAPAEGEDRNEDHLDFVVAVPAKAQEQLREVFLAAEKALAKKLGRKLEIADDDDPVDPDEEPVSDDEETEEDDQTTREAKMIARLVAERHLCDFASKIVFAISAAILDEDVESGEKGPMRTLLERNRHKLGKNYSEIVSSLDEKKAKKAVAKSALKKTAVGKSAMKKSDETVHDSDDEDEAEAPMRIDHEAEAEAEAEEAREQADKNGEDEEMEDVADEVESVAGD